MGMRSTNFREILGHFATGVTVVTALDAERRPHGLTVNAFSSLSLVPPLVLVCIEKTSECHSILEVAGSFAVNLLREDQEDLSRRFALRGVSKFEGVSWRRGENGAPLLRDAMGYLECRTATHHDGGDHTIFIGEVLRGDADGHRPLVFFKGEYTGLLP